MPKTILIVDDSSSLRTVVKIALVRAGYDVLEAGDGKEGLTQLDKAGKVNLIVSDVNMPHMDGITFVKTYRAQGGKSPIVMVTTEAEKTRVVEAIKAGVNNYVVKPFTPDSLSQRINETLTRAKAA
jgi:two-component system chemotaxis response regulator CheY